MNTCKDCVFWILESKDPWITNGKDFCCRWSKQNNPIITADSEVCQVYTPRVTQGHIPITNNEDLF